MSFFSRGINLIIKSSFVKKVAEYLFLLLPLIIIFPFFLYSDFILLDDHEVYRLHFEEINAIHSIKDDWGGLERVRPFYWVVRQTQSQLFGLSTYGWYLSSFFFLLISIVSFYLFLREIGLNLSLSIILSWFAFLNEHSINSWIALGPQEGIALCLLSISVFIFSKTFIYYQGKKHFWLAFLFILAATLTKESFLFSSLFAIFLYLYYSKNKKYTLSINIIYQLLFIPFFMLLVYTFRDLFVNSDSSVRGLSFETLKSFTDLISSSLFIISSFFIFITVFFKKITRGMKSKIGVIPMIVLLFLLFFQVFIYSTRDYIAPHYIQPFLFSVVFIVAIFIKNYLFKMKLTIFLLLLVLFPFSFFNVLKTVNSHNLYSRQIKNIETEIIKSNINNVIFVGLRSNDYEAIYSFKKRLSFLKPSLKFSFIDLDVSSEITPFDLNELFVEDYNYFDKSLLVVFHVQQINDNFKNITPTTNSLINIETYRTFYNVSPNYLIECNSLSCVERLKVFLKL